MCMRCKKYNIKWNGRHGSVYKGKDYVGSAEITDAGTCRVYSSLHDYLQMRLVALWENRHELNESISRCMDDMMTPA